MLKRYIDYVLFRLYPHRCAQGACDRLAYNRDYTGRPVCEQHRILLAFAIVQRTPSAHRRRDVPKGKR